MYQHCKTNLLFIPFQALVSVSYKRGMLYFDDQAKDGSTPTFSWTKMEMGSPFIHDWCFKHMISSLETDGQAVVSRGTLYIGAIAAHAYVVCSRYNMNTGAWEKLFHDYVDDVHNRADTCYDNVAEPSMVELDGYIYVIGGHDVIVIAEDDDEQHESYKSINKYDTANKCWENCCDLKAGVLECSPVIMDKKVLILDTKCYEEGTEENAIIQMYDPAKNESFIVLDATGLEIEDLQLAMLTVQSGSCYGICDPEQQKHAVSDPGDNDNGLSSPKQNDGNIQDEQYPRVFEQNPRVFKLVCNLDSNPPSVVLGEEIPQTHPHRNNYIRAFCIDGKTFVNVNGCVHKIKDAIANEDDLKKWRNITKTTQRPVHFTYDRRKLHHTTDEEESADEKEREEEGNTDESSSSSSSSSLSSSSSSESEEDTTDESESEEDE